MITALFFPQCSCTVLYAYWHGTEWFLIVFGVQSSLLQILNCAGKGPTYQQRHLYTVFGTATFQGSWQTCHHYTGDRQATYTTAQYSSGNTKGHRCHTISIAGPVWVQHSTVHSHTRLHMRTARCLLTVESAASSVEGTVVVVGAGAGEGGTGFIPGKGAGVVRRGKAEGAGALQLVLQTPADEGWFLGYFARLGVFVIVIIGQTNHGVGLRQVSAEGGTLGWLERESESGV